MHKQILKWFSRWTSILILNNILKFQISSSKEAFRKTWNAKYTLRRYQIFWKRSNYLRVKMFIAWTKKLFSFTLWSDFNSAFQSFWWGASLSISSSRTRFNYRLRGSHIKTMESSENGSSKKVRHSFASISTLKKFSVKRNRYLTSKSFDWFSTERRLWM